MLKYIAIRLNYQSSFPLANKFIKMFSTQAGPVSVSQHPITNENDVIIENVGVNGVITLNRPKALNALNLSMVKKIYSILKEWEGIKKMVVIKGSGNNAFCAGGDVKSIVLAIRDSDEGVEEAKKFFRAEYTLNHLIANYKRPYIAILNGIVMGGGVGLSVHGKYRIATEKAVFAMPETAIGLIPDVGSTYVLPKLNERLGMFLGLTGYQLKGADLVHSGIATHFVPSDKIDTVCNELLSPSTDIDEVLSEYLPQSVKETFSLKPYMKTINSCVNVKTVEEIIAILEAEKSEWAKAVAERLNKMSPTSLKLTKKIINKGTHTKTLAECLILEYRLVCSCLTKNSDFVEGVRAMLIDKDKKPIWNPKTLSEVRMEDIKKRFEPLSDTEDLCLSKL